MKEFVKKQIQEELERIQALTALKYFLVKFLVLSTFLVVGLCGMFTLATYSIKLGMLINAKFGWFWATNFFLAELSGLAAFILAGFIEDE